MTDNALSRPFTRAELHVHVAMRKPLGASGAAALGVQFRCSYNKSV